MTPNSFLLYRSARFDRPEVLHKAIRENPSAHHGLHFEKFFGWSTTDEGDGPEIAARDVVNWIGGAVAKGQSVSRDVGAQGALDEANERIRKLVESELQARFGAQTQQTTISLHLVSRLVTGLGNPHPIENGFLFHPTLAVPFLRGTALKQITRDRAVETFDEAKWWNRDSERKEAALDRLFGGVEERVPQGSGCLAFLDALPLAPVTIVAEQITGHYGAYYEGNPDLGGTRREVDQPADWHDPVPVSLLAVEATIAKPLTFQFAVVPLRGATRADAAAATEWLTQGLDAYGVGAKTTLGYGWFVNDERLNQLQEQDGRSARPEQRVTGTGLTPEEQARRLRAIQRK